MNQETTPILTDPLVGSRSPTLGTQAETQRDPVDPTPPVQCYMRGLFGPAYFDGVIRPEVASVAEWYGHIGFSYQWSDWQARLNHAKAYGYPLNLTSSPLQLNEHWEGGSYDDGGFAKIEAYAGWANERFPQLAAQLPDDTAVILDLERYPNWDRENTPDEVATIYQLIHNLHARYFKGPIYWYSHGKAKWFGDQVQAISGQCYRIWDFEDCKREVEAAEAKAAEHGKRAIIWLATGAAFSEDGSWQNGMFLEPPYTPAWDYAIERDHELGEWMRGRPMIEAIQFYPCNPSPSLVVRYGDPPRDRMYPTWFTHARATAEAFYGW